GVPVVVAAYLHAAMPAGVQEGMHASVAITGHDDAVLSHVGAEEVAWAGDLTLMPNEEPGAGEDPLLLLAIDVLVDVDLAADHAALHVDQLAHRRRFDRHSALLARGTAEGRAEHVIQAVELRTRVAAQGAAAPAVLCPGNLVAQELVEPAVGVIGVALAGEQRGERRQHLAVAALRGWHHELER